MVRYTLSFVLLAYTMLGACSHDDLNPNFNPFDPVGNQQEIERNSRKQLREEPREIDRQDDSEYRHDQAKSARESTAREEKRLKEVEELQPSEITTLYTSLWALFNDYIVTEDGHTPYNGIILADCYLQLGSNHSDPSNKITVYLSKVDEITVCCESSVATSFVSLKGANSLAHHEFQYIGTRAKNFRSNDDWHPEMYLKTTTLESAKRILPEFKQLITYCKSR